MLKLLLTAVVLGGLWFTNPPLEKFKEVLQQRSKEDRSAVDASAGFFRSITGITRLKQATGASSNYGCRLNLYLGSLFVLKHSSAAQAAAPTALGVGAAGMVYVKLLQDGSGETVLKPVTEQLGGMMQCESFLIN